MSLKLSIYVAHPMTGLPGEEVVKYYSEINTYLTDLGYMVFYPMIAKGYLQNTKELKPTGYHSPVSSDHAIKERDKWMVKNTQVLLLDLTGAKEKSIGCMQELAWGDHFGSHTIVVMEKDNITHQHAFVKQTADIVFEDMADAKVYLGKLIKGEM